MKVGVNLLNFGPGATPESLASWASFAEKQGFHFIAISDHVAVTPDVARQYPAPFYDPFTTLAWLAGITERVELATTVAILPYRHPLQLARIGANLDRIANGRLILGVGVGWAKQEFDALGIPFHRRGAMADDYLAAIRVLWTEDVASHEGVFVRFRDVETGPRPVRLPHPPIWVGGNGPAALLRAVRFGDAWHPINVRVASLTEKLTALREMAEAEARRVPSLSPRIKLRLTSQKLEEDERLAGEGTLDQVRGDFERLQSLGATHVLLDTFTGDVESTRDHQRYWDMLAAVAEGVVDLPNETVR
jgi:probable F420-dependent oxidoreductase